MWLYTTRSTFSPNSFRDFLCTNIWRVFYVSISFATSSATKAIISSIYSDVHSFITICKYDAHCTRSALHLQCHWRRRTVVALSKYTMYNHALQFASNKVLFYAFPLLAYDFSLRNIPIDLISLVWVVLCTLCPIPYILLAHLTFHRMKMHSFATTSSAHNAVTRKFNPNGNCTRKFNLYTLECQR